MVPDFLPSPAELAGVSRKSKVTLELETESLKFFKEKAKELGVPYQRMIRNLIEEYAARHKGS
ncbi:MAG: CopG family transcriptional regulator [Alphaproteobacteria bacterium]|nr:CopG family transcriptional regulator [Alphaproteobacteria bacterium]